MPTEPIPVTILSGSLGAGKTTLVNHLLHESGERRIAVLVNDMGEVNIDAELLDGADVSTAEGGVAELSNGCICCELQGDFKTEVVRLARQRDFDVLVVEASGISEPAPIARHFETGSRAAALYDVDTTVTVVDARQLQAAFAAEGEVARAETEDGETRPLSDLLVEQMEFCDVLLLNKCDLVSEGELDELEALVAAVQPDARIVRTVESAVDPDDVLETGRFDAAEAADRAGWKRAIEHAEGHDHDHGHDHGHSHDDHDDHGHSHPEAVYGVTSFVYRARKPLHPERFHEFLADFPEGVARAKGLFWVAGREDLALLLGQAGPSVRVTVTGPWIASRPPVERDMLRSNRPDLEWDDDWGDRKVELVFIGADMDEAAIRGALDDCLCTDAELEEGVAAENAFPAAEDAVLEF